MDLMYFYLRLPLLAIFALAGVDRVSLRAPGPPRRGLGAGSALVLAGAALALTAWMLLAATPPR
jgi:hypothetical protein